MLAHRSVLELGSKQVPELVQGKQVPVLDSILALVLARSKQVLVHSSHYHDDDDDDLLPLREQRTQPLPTPPQLESQTSWSNLPVRKNHLLGELQI